MWSRSDYRLERKVKKLYQKNNGTSCHKINQDDEHAQRETLIRWKIRKNVDHDAIRDPLFIIYPMLKTPVNGDQHYERFGTFFLQTSFGDNHVHTYRTNKTGNKCHFCIFRIFTDWRTWHNYKSDFNSFGSSTLCTQLQHLITEKWETQKMTLLTEPVINAGKKDSFIYGTPDDMLNDN